MSALFFYFLFRVYILYTVTNIDIGKLNNILFRLGSLLSASCQDLSPTQTPAQRETTKHKQHNYIFRSDNLTQCLERDWEIFCLFIDFLAAASKLYLLILIFCWLDKGIYLHQHGKSKSKRAETLVKSFFTFLIWVRLQIVSPVAWEPPHPILPPSWLCGQSCCCMLSCLCYESPGSSHSTVVDATHGAALSKPPPLLTSSREFLCYLEMDRHCWLKTRPHWLTLLFPFPLTVTLSLQPLNHQKNMFLCDICINVLSQLFIWPEYKLNIILKYFFSYCGR